MTKKDVLKGIVDCKHDVILGIRVENPKDLPIEILKVYLHNIEGSRWSSTAFGSTEESSKLVKSMNEKLDKESEALRKAIKLLQE